MKLPVVSGDEAGKVLKKRGFEFAEQDGSHMHFRRRNPPHIKITVPRHKELKRSTLRSILRAANLTVEEFRDLL